VPGLKRRIASLTIIVAAACRGETIAAEKVCQDTNTVMFPAETTIAVGNQFVANAQVMMCSGMQRIQDDFVWYSQSGDVVVVHEDTRLVQGLARGVGIIHAAPFHSSHIGNMTVTVR